jgi:hypothetical protein
MTFSFLDFVSLVLFYFSRFGFNFSTCFLYKWFSYFTLNVDISLVDLTPSSDLGINHRV